MLLLPMSHLDTGFQAPVNQSAAGGQSSSSSSLPLNASNNGAASSLARDQAAPAIQRRALTAAERANFLPSELRQYQAERFSSLLAIPTEPLPVQCEWA
mmetsp:Transcript_20698/g.43520  ORF Transcript_20698/g.43520 Transcript_20698/m.43520 type:complete len:99 (+) Transcript_20698:794-1090(+)